MHYVIKFKFNRYRICLFSFESHYGINKVYTKLTTNWCFNGKYKIHIFKAFSSVSTHMLQNVHVFYTLYTYTYLYVLNVVGVEPKQFKPLCGWKSGLHNFQDHSHLLIAYFLRIENVKWSLLFAFTIWFTYICTVTTVHTLHNTSTAFLSIWHFAKQLEKCEWGIFMMLFLFSYLWNIFLHRLWK